jgi:hypothetical protein
MPSNRTVYAAIGANLAVATAKFVARCIWALRTSC